MIAKHYGIAVVCSLLASLSTSAGSKSGMVGFSLMCIASLADGIAAAIRELKK